MKRFILIALILTCHIHARPLATVYYSKGKAYLQKENKLTLLKKGMSIDENQTIITKEKSLAIIGFGPYYQSKMKVAAGSELYITQSLAKSMGAIPNRNYNIFLKAGNALVNFAKTKNKSLTVHTKTAALGVRGTSFFTNIDQKGTMSMTVEKGTVAVSAANSELQVPVKKGEGTMTNAKAKIIAPRKLNWHKKVNWNMSPAKGKLYHSTDLFKSIEASYQKYKKEQEAKLKNYRKEQKQKVDSWKQRNESLKKKMFDSR